MARFQMVRPFLEEDAVTVACAQLESLWTSAAQKSIH
jgi:hypothetical protein